MAYRETENPKKIMAMFEEGRRFTEELLEENKRLRLALQGSKNRSRQLEEKAEPELRHLEQRLQLLKEENQLLKEELQDVKRQFNEIEKENWDFSERYLHVERQNASLLSLYVASQRLHSTLAFSETIQVLKEVVVNLLGSEAFDICLFDGESHELLVLAALGTASKVGGRVPVGQRAKSALDAGRVFEAAEHQPDGQPMAVCVPLKLGDRILGAILIRKLLAHKAGLESGDHELFDLLGERAVSALCASYLFTELRVDESPNRWRKTIRDMSREASELEGRDIEPTVLW